MGWSPDYQEMWPDSVKITNPSPDREFAFVRSDEHTKELGEILHFHHNASPNYMQVESGGILIRKNVEPGLDKVALFPGTIKGWEWRTWVNDIVASQQTTPPPA